MKMPRVEREKIDGLHWPCAQPASRGQIESARMHSEVVQQFDLLSLLKLLLLRNWHCWSFKAFIHQMRANTWEITAKTAVLRHHCQAWKVVLSIAAVRQHPRNATKLAVFFRFFRVFPLTFQWKTGCIADLQVFKRPVFCKNPREMVLGSNDLSTYAPLKASWKLGKIH